VPVPKRIESALNDEPQHMIEFQDGDSTWSENGLERSRELGRVRYVGQKIVVDHEVRCATVRDELMSCREAEWFGEDRASRVGRGIRQRGGPLHDDAPDASLREEGL
jgi:hypothetical protein